jgi:hypothetical protein
MGFSVVARLIAHFGFRSLTPSATREYWIIFIEDQAFLRSSDSVPRPPPPPSPVIKLSLFLSLPVYRRYSLSDGRGEGWTWNTTARNPGFLKSFNTLCQLATSNHHGVFFIMYSCIRSHEIYFLFKILSVAIEHETAILSQETETIQEAVHDLKEPDHQKAAYECWGHCGYW